MSIEEIIYSWSEEDLQNLIKILDPNEELKNKYNDDLKSKVIHLFRRKYYSVSRAKIKNSVVGLMNQLKLSGKTLNEEQAYPIPLYEILLVEACKKTNTYVEGASFNLLEKYLIETIIIKALFEMEPNERHKALTIKYESMPFQNSSFNESTSGPLTALSFLTLANASGFGVYMSATTALGFLTHAIGVTLPFAAYTGLTSTIAFLIGPVGWLGAGVYGFWKLTGVDWNKIIPALIYIISVKYRAPQKDEMPDPKSFDN